jgi:hypothetical protein
VAAYATVEELTAFMDGYEPPGAARLLDRASRDIDRVLLCAVYDVDDADIQAVLKVATLEQVAYQLVQGNVDGIRHGLQAGVPAGSSAGAVNLSRGQSVGGDSSGLPLIGEQAWSALQAAGIRFQGPIPA